MSKVAQGQYIEVLPMSDFVALDLLSLGLVFAT